MFRESKWEVTSLASLIPVEHLRFCSAGGDHGDHADHADDADDDVDLRLCVFVL